MIDWHIYIESNPSVLFGKPIIKNSRISVELILEKLALGDTYDDLIEAYPILTKEKIAACLLFATDTIKNDIVYLKAS